MYGGLTQQLFADTDEICSSYHVATNIPSSFTWFFRLLSEIALQMAIAFAPCKMGALFIF